MIHCLKNIGHTDLQTIQIKNLEKLRCLKHSPDVSNYPEKNGTGTISLKERNGQMITDVYNQGGRKYSTALSLETHLLIRWLVTFY